MNQQIPRSLTPIELNNWLSTSPSKPVLVDVREQQELAIATFPAEIIHLPLSQASQWLNNLPQQLSKQKPLVIICHSGIRSWDFANWLIDQGWNEVWNLEGGIDAWSIHVDSTVPRY